MQNTLQRAAAALAFAASVLLSANAHAVAVDLELALAVDVSGSVNASEFALQRDAYVAAFQSDAIQDAIAAGTIGSIAVNYYYWSTGAPTAQTGWTLIDSDGAADAFADDILNLDPGFGAFASTGIANALTFGVDELLDLNADNGFEGERLVIDISGDGTENVNTNAAVNAQRDRAEANDITINGLAILTDVATLDDYYEANLQTSDGFTVAAADFDAFQTAIEDKLEAEIIIDPPPNGDIPLPATVLLMLAGLFAVGRFRRA